MSEFISRTALKEALGIESTDAVDDSILSNTIWRASALVDNYLATVRPGWVGISGSSNSRGSVGSNTRRYDGTGDDMLWIDDASSVASVTVDDTAIASTAYELWPYNEGPKRAVVYISPTSSVHGLTSAIWSRGTANVDVVGFFGLPTVPEDIAQVSLALSILLWRRHQSGEPAPGPEIAMGGRVISKDPEVDGILETLWPRWGRLWVGGA
jgi:hypothetical protein